MRYIVQVAGEMNGKSLAVKEKMFIILQPVPAQTHRIDAIKVMSKFVFAKFTEFKAQPCSNNLKPGMSDR